IGTDKNGIAFPYLHKIHVDPLRTVRFAVTDRSAFLHDGERLYAFQKSHIMRGAGIDEKILVQPVALRDVVHFESDDPFTVQFSFVEAVVSVEAGFSIHDAQTGGKHHCSAAPIAAKALRAIAVVVVNIEVGRGIRVDQDNTIGPNAETPVAHPGNLVTRQSSST